jgi:hypothetical protein
MPYLRIPPGHDGLKAALAAAGITHAGPADGLVFVASGPALGEDWDAIALELEEAFTLSQQSVRAGANVVYVVAGEDLLGQRGAGAAMVACGLLSAARTVGFEGAKPGFTANTVAPEAGSDPTDTARWIERMLDSRGSTGELVRIGPGHLGKALP